MIKFIAKLGFSARQLDLARTPYTIPRALGRLKINLDFKAALSDSPHGPPLTTPGDPTLFFNPFCSCLRSLLPTYASAPAPTCEQFTSVTTGVAVPAQVARNSRGKRAAKTAPAAGWTDRAGWACRIGWADRVSWAGRIGWEDRAGEG